MQKSLTCNNDILGNSLVSLLLSMAISIILLQVLLYLFFGVSKTYYKINTEINLIQDAEILKQHISKDLTLEDQVAICPAYDFSCFDKIPQKIQKKMLKGMIRNNSSVLLIKKPMPANKEITYYLAGDTVMRNDNTSKKSVAIIDHVTNFTMVAVNKHKYNLVLHLSGTNNINIKFSKKIFLLKQQSN